MAEKRLTEIKKVRLEKVEVLRKKGINPYVSKPKGTRIDIADARGKLGKNVSVAGRIMGLRAHGNATFVDLKDASEKIQLLYQNKNLKDYDLLKLFDIGDFVWAKGEVVKTQAGEITIDVFDFQLLTKSIRPLPSTWYGLKDVEDR